MNRDDIFGIILLIGFTIFFIIFVIWAYQQYRLQKQIADEELQSLRRTQYAISQLYKSGAMDNADDMKRRKSSGKEEVIIIDKKKMIPSNQVMVQRFAVEDFEDGKTSIPGAELPKAFERAIEKAELSPDGNKLKYVFPGTDFSMEFGEKPDLAVDINTKELKINPPPKCSNVTNQYIYELNKKIMEQNKQAEKINKEAAKLNRQNS